MALVIVGVHQVLDDIYPANGAAVRQICPYPGLDSAVESLYHGVLLIAMTSKVLNLVTLHL